MIRLTVPVIEDDDLKAVEDVLRTGFLVQGKNVAAFEAAVANVVGVRHAVAVSNCTAALHMALLAVGVGPGDTVAVPAYSWLSTANVVELCGATPVFVDVLPDTFNLDPERLEAVLRGVTVKVILPVHAFGGIAPVERLRELADAHGAILIEDAACALGTEWKGRQAGAWGTMGCFSFHPRKAVTTGEGGMITTDDADLARRLRALRNHGMDPEATAPDFIMAGFNYRLTEFQAALGVSQMAKLDRIVASRIAQADRYAELLADTPVIAPRSVEGSRHVYQSYVALLPTEAAARRPTIIAGMKAAGVETTIGTHHMPMTRFFREKYGFKPGDFPVADDIAARAISLPMYETLTGDDQRTVVEALLSAIGGEKSRPAIHG